MLQRQRGLDFCFISWRRHPDRDIQRGGIPWPPSQNLCSTERLQCSYQPSKVWLGQLEVKFLGHLVSVKGTCPLPEKDEAIRAYSEPTTAKQLRQFQGTVNFNRRFLTEEALIQAQLNTFVQGNINEKLSFLGTRKLRKRSRPAR